jgi:predicted NBD/HSP70 family sugar kinase
LTEAIEMPLRATPGSPALLRRLNAALVLRVIRAQGPISRPELAEATGLSQPTVNQIARLLLRNGYLRDRRAKATDRPLKRGPRATMLSFNAGAGYVLGIDISAGKLVILAADLTGRLIAENRTLIDRREMLRPAPLLALVRRRTRRILDAAGIARHRLMAVGIGTPGIVDPRSGRINLAPALPDWEGVRLAERLAKSFPCPIHIESDVHLAVLAERGFGAAKGIDDAVYLHLGVGIGLGILIGGRLHRGADGAAGEIAYLQMGAMDRPPEAGFGRFEWACGSQAFARLGLQAIRARRRPGLLGELVRGEGGVVTPRIVFEAARRGDSAASHIVRRLVGQLAEGVAAIVCVLNPATVILGAEIAEAGDQLIQPLRAQVAKLVPRPPLRYVASSLGDEAVALGALQVALQAVSDGPFADPANRPPGAGGMQGV